MQIKNLAMSFGTQVLFENINLNISKNEKVGVLGIKIKKCNSTKSNNICQSGMEYHKKIWYN